MMNEEEDNPSWPSLLIDLDLGVRKKRENPSRAPNKTGARAFMAIGALYGEKRTYMHDLGSFLGVLFWICIHYGTGQDKVWDSERREAFHQNRNRTFYAVFPPIDSLGQ